MTIYGVSIIAFCFIVGKILGYALGSLVGIDSDVGGVGFAMFLLVMINAFLTRRGLINEQTRSGIIFWSSMYIPVVIAMSASQNVRAALSGGIMAITVGVLATLLVFSLVPLIAKIGAKANGLQHD